MMAEWYRASSQWRHMERDSDFLWDWQGTVCRSPTLKQGSRVHNKVWMSKGHSDLPETNTAGSLWGHLFIHRRFLHQWVCVLPGHLTWARCSFSILELYNALAHWFCIIQTSARSPLRLHLNSAMKYDLHPGHHYPQGQNLKSHVSKFHSFSKKVDWPCPV